MLVSISIPHAEHLKTTRNYWLRVSVNQHRCEEQHRAGRTDQRPDVSRYVGQVPGPQRRGSSRKTFEYKPGSRGENADFSRHEMVRLHQTADSHHGHHATNPLVALLRTMFTVKLRGMLKEENPVRGIKLLRGHESLEPLARNTFRRWQNSTGDGGSGCADKAPPSVSVFVLIGWSCYPSDAWTPSA